MQQMLSVQRASKQDAALVGKIHAAAWRTAYPGLIPQSYLSTVTPQARAQLFLRVLENDLADYYLASVNGVPAGIVILLVPRGEDVPLFSLELGAFYLLPLYWGQGYGLQMMHWVAETAQRAGYQSLTLWVLEENLQARRFYEKYGFTQNGAAKQVEYGRVLNQLHYRLELPALPAGTLPNR